jgi:soluble lytic murein transglycosylase-like protein
MVMSSPLQDIVSGRSYGGAGSASDGSALRTIHTTLVQAALDRARRLGISLSLPIRPRVDGVMAVAPSARAGEARVGSFDEELRTAAAREGIDADLVRAVAKVESGGNASAVSHAGAKGLMQLMDGTARSLGVTDSFDPSQNAAGGAKYLRQMLNRFGGDVTKALAAYNAGPGTVERFGGVPPYSETQGYVRKVLQTREQLRRAGS